MDQGKTDQQWTKASAKSFWGEIAPGEHVVQIYEDDDVLLDLLEGFVSSGLKNGDCVIVIATTSHLLSLNNRLTRAGFSLFDLTLYDQYIPLDAEKTLAKFMVDEWPDETLFMHLVSNLLTRARRHSGRVYAFGEMVALLWGQGKTAATLKLEHLWNKFIERESFSLFCAYPRSGFKHPEDDTIEHVCGAHSKLISNFGRTRNDLLFKNVARVNYR